MKLLTRLPFSWLCTFGAALFLLIYPVLFSRVIAEASAASTVQIFSDTLLPGAARRVGTAAQGTPLTEGGVKWSSNQDITVRGKGATASNPGGAHHLLDKLMGEAFIFKRK